LAGRLALRLVLPDPPPGDTTVPVVGSTKRVHWVTNALRVETDA
jgi:hypothetical protein